MKALENIWALIGIASVCRGKRNVNSKLTPVTYFSPKINMKKLPTFVEVGCA
jgi:hypothetical protein